MTNDQTRPFREVTAAEAVALAREGYRVIDVREQSEWDSGHVAGATLLPLGDVPARIGEVAPDKDSPLLLHCAVGGRSARAAGRLAEMGYTNVVSMKAPIGQWKEQGGEWEEPRQLLTPSQQRRYARQTLIPEIGQEGQRKLLDAKVLLIGAGAPRLALRALPVGIGRGHHRPGRRRPGRGVQPPAPGAPRPRADRDAQGRLG